MKILVPVKRVPDPTQKAKIKDGHIDLTGASWIVNTFDEYAVETALRLLENGESNTRTGGEIIVVTIGPEDAAKSTAASSTSACRSSRSSRSTCASSRRTPSTTASRRPRSRTPVKARACRR